MYPSLRRRTAVLRLVGLFTLLCIVPLALLTYFTIHLAESAVVREVNARVQATSAVTAVLVQEQMQAVADLTQSYATRPVLVAALADGDPAHYDNRAIGAQLTQLRAAQVGNGGVFLTDATCRLTDVEPATPSIVGSDFSFRDWCKGVQATNRPYVSVAYRSAITGTPLVVAAAAPVRSTSGVDVGKPLGIVAVVYKLDAIRAVAAQLAQAQGIHLTITDQLGTVIVPVRPTTDPNRIELESAASDPRVREALAQRSGLTRSTTSNGDALSAFAPVEKLGWAVVAEVPARKALAGMRHLRSAVLSVAAPLALVMLAGAVALARTLRRRRQAERDLLARELHTRSILDAATDAFIAMDADGVITEWKGQAEELFGLTEHDALGRTLSDTIIPPALREAHERGLSHYLATGEGPVLNQRIEVTALHGDGHEMPIELAIWPVRTDDSWCFNAFVHDITERKRTEAELATARDQALEASKLKSEFLANMSHEIRTPMNGVLGMTSLLLETDLKLDQREFAETVQACGESLLGILNDILDFSKIEAGRLDVECIDFDLRALVEDVASLLSFPAHSKGLELLCILPDDLPPTIRGDPGRLRQILTNLVGNAVKFTAAGEVVLGVTLVEEEAEEGATNVHFMVSDTGIGIAEADQATMFEPFSQADASTTRRYGGTGLGLAISRQLAELMGGTIGVKSELGHGSTFWCTVPFQNAVSLQVMAVPRASLAGRRMLIVDDNATNRAILARFLQAWGVQSATADSAQQARQLLATSMTEGNPFDAALLDLNMPDVDGIELARAIAASPVHRLMKTVLLTSSSQGVEPVAAQEAGIAAFLAKPVRQAQLYDCLATLLGSPQAVSNAVVSPARSTPTGGAGRILLAEDNIVNQRVAAAMLERLGYEVDVVANGAEAVRAVTASPYLAVLLDCQMPVMDGYGAAREIRRLEAGAVRTTIIAVTASAMKSDEEDCLSAGMDDYLAKPLTIQTLEAILSRWTPGRLPGAERPPTFSGRR